jgi:hypothetical protein
MIHQLLTTEYLFWLVALAFYLLDCIKLVGKSEILITETFTGKFKPSFSFNTFEIKGKQVQLLNLLIPYTGFLKLNITPNDRPSNNFENTKEKLITLQKVALPFKAISLISFLYLLSGPVLTFYQGLGATLILLLPLHLTSLLMTLALLLISRKGLGLNYGSLISIFFDCLVVPAYLPSIVRKIYNKQVFTCDGYYFSLKTNSPKNFEELEYNISRKLSQAIDQVDENEAFKYLSYKESLGIKNDQ